MARRRSRKLPGPTSISFKPLLRRILINIPDLIISGETLKTNVQRFELGFGNDSPEAGTGEQFDHIVLSVVDTSGEQDTITTQQTFQLEEFGGSPLLKEGDFFKGSLGDLDRLTEACLSFITTNKVEPPPPPPESEDSRPSRPRRRPGHDRSRRQHSRDRRPPRNRDRSS